MSQRLDNAIGLYMQGIRDGNPRAAITRFTGARYTQHSSGVRDGADGFVAFFEPFLARNPKRDIRVVRAIEDGRHVFCHAYQSLNAGESQWVTMDLFDTDDDGRIVEHWDVIAPFAARTPSGHSSVDGPEKVEDADASERNKRQVLEYVKQVVQGRRHDLLEQFVASNVVQHVADLADGLPALAGYLKSGDSGQYEMLFRLIGHGNFVVSYGKVHAGGKDLAVFDLYRLSAGKIVERWDVREEIPPRETWVNSGKF